jgi:hypothetical protein
MFKLSSAALCCAMFGAGLAGTAVEAEAKKGTFARAVGVGVGVGIAKQVMRPKRDRSGDSDEDTSASAVSAPAAGMMLATPVANTAPAKQPPAAEPSAPVGDGKTVCVAGCY